MSSNTTKLFNRTYQEVRPTPRSRIVAPPNLKITDYIFLDHFDATQEKQFQAA